MAEYSCINEARYNVILAGIDYRAMPVITKAAKKENDH